MIEDDVVVYGGATILGRITVGKGSVIGGRKRLAAPGNEPMEQTR